MTFLLNFTENNTSRARLTLCSTRAVSLVPSAANPKDIECTRLAMALYGVKFYHDRKISPGWGGTRLLPFTISFNTYKFVVYAPGERADQIHRFQIYPYLYSVAMPPLKS